MSEYVILAGSLNPESNSALLAQSLQREYAQLGIRAELLDLRQHSLPLCDGGAAYEHPGVTRIGTVIKAARVVIVATPVYNFDANAAVKNVIELTGSAWEDKVVGFVCAAGGDASYMSIMSLANSLMLDFRCLIIPRFVYATSGHFSNDAVTSPEIIQRLQRLAQASLEIHNAQPTR
jgi:FMN reductase